MVAGLRRGTAEKTIKAAWELARRSKTDQLEREIAVAELLRAQGYYVISN